MSILFTSCKENGQERQSTVAKKALPPTKANSLGSTAQPTTLLLDNAHSKVNWQPWSKQVFEDAKQENKTVFFFIGKSTDSHTHEILKKINASPSACKALNQSHINVLIDAHQHPEVEFFVATLNANMGNPFPHTQVAWFTYEGAPISWAGIIDSDRLDIHKAVTRMSNTVSHLWGRDNEYVLKNGRRDLVSRIETIAPTKLNEKKPQAVTQAIRQAASLFDPISNSIDNISSLSPARYTNLMVTAVSHPDISQQQRQNYLKTAILTAENILLKNLIDPLDGGVFTNNNSTVSSLPTFTKTLWDQIYSMEALYGLYQITSDQKYLHAANSIQAYIENSLSLSGGGHAQGIIYSSHNLIENPCLWTIEEIESSLSKTEVELCIQAFGISGLGNVSISEERSRNYFRKNVIIWKKTIDQLAKKLDQSPQQLETKFDSITKKLAKLRQEKIKDLTTCKLVTVSSQAALCSAYIKAYRVTKDQKHLENAQKLINFIRSEFKGDQGQLLRCRFNNKTQDLPANGIDYALVCRAALDVHEVTLEADWLQWANEIQTSMMNSLGNGDFSDLLESPNSNYPSPLDIRIYISLKPINNLNTWAYTLTNAQRLAMRGLSVEAKEEALQLRNGFARFITGQPLSCIDYLSEQTKIEYKIVYFKPPISQEMVQASLAENCQLILVTENTQYPDMQQSIISLQAGQTLVTQQGKVVGTADSAENLNPLLK